MPDVNFTATKYGLWNNNYDGDTNVSPSRCGMYLRGQAYVYETLCKFDVSSLAGKTIDSAYLQFTVTNKGSGTEELLVYAMEQNKLNPTSWSSPPVYDDFGNFPGTHTYWDTELSNVSAVRDTGTYTILDTSNNIKDLVQAWIDDSNDNWGLVLTRNDSATSRWIEIGEVKLFVSYTDTGTTKYSFTTPGETTFEIPSGITSIVAKLWAGGGGGGAGGSQGVGGDGGGGGYVKGRVSVSPGQILQIHVAGKGENGVYGGSASGGAGGAGYCGGGGGSGSAPTNAGGGGGGGGSNYLIGTATETVNLQASGQNPPNTGDPDYSGSVGVGGDGGALTGAGSDGYDGKVVLITEAGAVILHRRREKSGYGLK